VIVLFSIVVYYGMERLAKESKARNQEQNNLERAEHWVFWIGIGTLAILFRFIVNDHGPHGDQRPLRR
jgi:hypothetical protein